MPENDVVNRMFAAPHHTNSAASPVLALLLALAFAVYESPTPTPAYKVDEPIVPLWISEAGLSRNSLSLLQIHRSRPDMGAFLFKPYDVYFQPGFSRNERTT